MKKLFIIFCLLAALLSDIMCAVVAYNYRDMLCSIDHAGYSAPQAQRFSWQFPILLELLFASPWRLHL